MLRGMDSPALAAAPTLKPPAQLPGWALSRGREPTETDAAFAAGIALKKLDDLVRSEPAWAGCWRSRQALKMRRDRRPADGPYRGRGSAARRRAADRGW